MIHHYKIYDLFWGNDPWHLRAYERGMITEDEYKDCCTNWRQREHKYISIFDGKAHLAIGRTGSPMFVELYEGRAEDIMADRLLGLNSGAGSCK